MTYKTTFKVIGTGTFPLDMLRYDCCYPLDSSTASDLGLEPRLEEVTVYLEKWHQGTSYPRITEGRWRSFGWRVVVHEKTDMRLGTVKA